MMVLQKLTIKQKWEEQKQYQTHNSKICITHTTEMRKHQLPQGKRVIREHESYDEDAEVRNVLAENANKPKRSRERVGERGSKGKEIPEMRG